MDGNYWEHSRAERMNSQGRQIARGEKGERGRESVESVDVDPSHGLPLPLYV